MARPKLKECSNCHGKEEKCKFQATGRPCRIGKAKGKAKGKAISDKTLEKREKYDSLLGDHHTDYLNLMRNKQINIILNEETGEIHSQEISAKVYSFERYLNLIGQKTLASYFRYNYGDLDSYNFTDFNTIEDNAEWIEDTENI